MNPHNTPIGDSECDANAAVYVLGALPQDEYEAFLIHLDSCTVCREEVASLQGVATLLPAAVPQREAPAALKQRVMTEVHQEAERARASEAGALRTQAVRTERWKMSVIAPLGLALALAIALAIVLVSGNGSGGGARRVEAQVSSPGARASVLLSSDHAQLTLAHMPQAGRGRVYEVWIVHSGAPAPAPTATLFTVTSNGSATVGVPGSITGVKEILVTSEPAGGTLVPTRAPVIIAKLT